MKYDYTISDNHITVTIKDTTADKFIAELVRVSGLDVIELSGKIDFRDAIEELAMEYIAEERPTVDYYRSDEFDTVDVLNVKIHCGLIFDEYQFIGDVSGIRYNKIGRGVYA